MKTTAKDTATQRQHADELDASQTEIYNREYAAEINRGSAPEEAHERAMEKAAAATPAPAAHEGTPTPWMVLSPAYITARAGPDWPKHVIAQVGRLERGEVIPNKANAALIVTAVNERAGLLARVAALEYALNKAADFFDNGLASAGLDPTSEEDREVAETVSKMIESMRKAARAQEGGK